MEIRAIEGSCTNITFQEEDMCVLRIHALHLKWLGKILFVQAFFRKRIGVLKTSQKYSVTTKSLLQEPRWLWIGSVPCPRRMSITQQYCFALHHFVHTNSSHRSVDHLLNNVSVVVGLISRPVCGVGRRFRRWIEWTTDHEFWSVFWCVVIKFTDV